MAKIIDPERQEQEQQAAEEGLNEYEFDSTEQEETTIEWRGWSR